LGADGEAEDIPVFLLGADSSINLYRQLQDPQTDRAAMLCCMQHIQVAGIRIDEIDNMIRLLASKEAVVRFKADDYDSWLQILWWLENDVDGEPHVWSAELPKFGLLATRTMPPDEIQQSHAAWTWAVFNEEWLGRFNIAVANPGPLIEAARQFAETFGGKDTPDFGRHQCAVSIALKVCRGLIAVACPIPLIGS
jgi:hypothetical protein